MTVEFTREFDRKIEKALKSVGDLVVKKTNDILTRETDSQELSSSYKSRVTPDSVVVYSEKPESVYVEWGTGMRGRDKYKQYFDEDKPTFTVPIVPKNKKALHWKDKSGKDVFAKSTKGMSPIAPLRRAVFENKSEMTRVFKESFK